MNPLKAYKLNNIIDIIPADTGSISLAERLQNND